MKPKFDNPSFASPANSVGPDQNSICDPTEPLGELSPAEQQKLTEILDEYLQQIEDGKSPDVDRLLTEHPQWKGVLQRYFESLGVLHHAAQGINAPAPELPAAIDLPNNRQLGDYEIRRQIGRGGMGIVYEARQISLDRRVALKVLPLAAVLDQKQIARFRRESQAAAQLHHPHIVPVFGVGCESGVHFYSMQLVDGQSIDRVLHSIRREPDATRVLSAHSGGETTIAEMHATTIEQPCEPENEPSESFVSGTISDGTSVCDRKYIDRVAELGIQAASALQHAHDYGVIHRDIKPSNLMLDRDGKLWITDFGLAYVQSENDMTATGDLVGTLRYMSPEQAAGSGVIDQRTDVYSLGITLYEMLTLRKAIPTRERARLLSDIETLEPKRMRKINASIPKDLETVILKAISKDRDQRYATAEDFADDLQRFCDGKPTMARRPTLIDLGTKWAFRHRGVVACLMLLMVSALIGTSAALFLIQEEQSRTSQAKEQTVAEKQKAERHLILANAQREQAIETLEQITRLSRRLTKQPGIQRTIQIETRELFKEFVAAAHDGNTTFLEFAETHNRIGGMSEQLGEYDVAVASYREAARAYDELVAQDPIHRHAAGLNLNNLGQALTRIGEVSEAESCYEAALQIFQELQATSADEQQIARGIALVVGNLGYLASQTGDSLQARVHFERAIEIRTSLLRDHPDNIDDQIRLASNYHNLSSLLVDNDLESAERLCRQAIALQESAAEARPREIEPRVDLALSWNNLGSIRLRQKQLDNASERYTDAVNVGRVLIREAPEIPQLRHDLAISCNNLGRTLAANGDLQLALDAYVEAGSNFEALLTQFPEDASTLARYGGTLYNQAIVRTQLASPDATATAQLFERAIQCQRRSVQLAPDTAQYGVLLEHSLGKFATFLQQTGNLQRSEAVQHELASLRAEGLPREN